MVDEFIIYDEVQYTKMIGEIEIEFKTPSGSQWITIPVYQKSLMAEISETQVAITNGRQKTGIH